MADLLTRRYRRLLFAYPRAYRRLRGDELLSALLDAAPPERTRPTAREAADLIRHGLRARLGRPASRTVVAWAVLTVVISGVFSAAFATRAAWETARPLPRTAETQAMLAEILPGQEFTGIQDAPAMFVIYGQPLSWNAARDLLLGDGGEYAQSGIAGGVSAPTLPPQGTVELVQHNLRAHGWTVYPLTAHDAYGCSGPPCDPATIPQYTTIVARRGDTVFTMEVHPPEDPVSLRITAGFVRATPFAVYPFGLTGGILGAVVTFLLFGWASRRTEGRQPARTVVKILLGITLFFWWAPTLLAVPQEMQHHLEEPHPSWHPMWEWLGQPTFSLLFLIGCGSALLGLVLATLPRSDREPLSTAAA
ncbi:hypothetical protein GCM10010399_04280 [Dactylosporangium fulvum]|uniref:Integral membrane protein n=1 Tax=Dactylosporangium fulvum TaxID=53359 RepID=A0ABY5VQC0_9ACTN|nr:hypothetical protein [Dactylosporangium fulvum]UWP79972.1 hypothetical protein Dfulv_33055 [Dactylosporangium fulvum]